jgi:hypothetical protein
MPTLDLEPVEEQKPDLEPVESKPADSYVGRGDFAREAGAESAPLVSRYSPDEKSGMEKDTKFLETPVVSSGVARAPFEASAAVLSGGLVPLTQTLFPESAPAKIVKGATAAAGDIASSLTTPENLGLLAAGGPLAKLGKLGTVLISSAFEAQALKQAPEQWNKFKEAWNKGDLEKATRTGADLLAGVTLPAAAVAIHGATSPKTTLSESLGSIFKPVEESITPATDAALQSTVAEAEKPPPPQPKEVIQPSTPTGEQPAVVSGPESPPAAAAPAVEESAAKSGLVETVADQPSKKTDSIPQPSEGLQDIPPETAQSIPAVRSQPQQTEMVRGLATQARDMLGPGAAYAGEFSELAKQNSHEYAAIGAAHLLEGGADKASWTSAMREEYGVRDATPTELNKIWRDSHDLLFDFNEAQTGKALRPKKQIEEATGVRPTTAPIREQLQNSISKAQGLSEYLRGQEKGSRLGAAVRQEQLRMADKWLSADQQQVRQHLTEFVNKTLPPGERGRFIGAIGRALTRPDLIRGDPATMYRNAFRVMRAIENRAEDVYKGNLVDEIKSTINKSIDAPGVDVQYRRGITELLDKISLTKPTKETLGRAKSLQDFIDKERAAGREPNIPKEELEQVSILSKMPLRDMTANSLEQLRDDLDNFVSLGRLKTKLMERAWERNKQRSVTELSQAPASPIETRDLYRPQPTEKLSVGEKFINRVRQTLNARVNFEQAIAPMDEIYDHLDGATGTYNGWASRNIKGKVDLAFNKTQAELAPLKEQGRQIIEKNNLTKSDLETVGVKGIVNMIGRQRLEAMGVRADILDRIEKTPLTKGQQAYYDFTRKTYDELGTRVKDVAHQLYQQDMGIVKDYVPLMRDWAAFAEREPPAPTEDPIAGEIPFNETATMQQLRHDMNPKALSRTEQGFLIDRIQGAKTAVKVNAQEVFERHINDALHFVHAQPVLKMLGEIVRTPDFEAKYGKAGQQIVLDHLDTIANQGYVNHLQRIRWIDWIRNSTSKGAVGFRLASNIVHTSQLPLEAYHAGGAGWWSKGLELTLTEKGQEFLRKNAAETFVRSGGEPAQADVEMISKVGKAGFFIARNVDKIGAQATFLGRYAKEMQKAGVPVDSVLDAPVNSELQSLALRRMHRAVASPQGKDIPQMTSRGKGVGGNVSVARAINQFRNIFLDNWSNIRHDLLRVGTKDGENIIESLRQGELAAGAKQVGDAASHRAAVAFAVLAGVAMETGIKLYVKKGIQSGTSAITGVEPKLKKEEETYLGDLRYHLINRIPFVGQLGTMLMYGDTGVPVIDAIVSPVKETGQALFKSRKPETTAKHLIRAGSAGATLLGVPGSSQVIEAAEPKATEQFAKVIPDRSKPKKEKTRGSLFRGFSIKRRDRSE